MLIRPKQILGSGSAYQKLVWDATNGVWKDSIGFIDYLKSYAASYSTTSSTWAEIATDLTVPSHWVGGTILHIVSCTMRNLRSTLGGGTGGVGLSLGGSTPSYTTEWSETAFDATIHTSCGYTATSTTLKAWARANSGTVYLENISNIAFLIQGRGANP